MIKRIYGAMSNADASIIAVKIPSDLFEATASSRLVMFGEPGAN
jgi:hypothetical protein